MLNVEATRAFLANKLGYRVVTAVYTQQRDSPLTACEICEKFVGKNIFRTKQDIFRSGRLKKSEQTNVNDIF